MKIHLVGVGGVAMGNLAAMLRFSGHTVTGSDHALYPPMSDRLQEWGIEATPFAKENVGQADLYIIGNAISRGNPEVEEILNQNLDYTSMSVALQRFFLQGKEVIVVAGTHGKTTTTFLMDHILREAGHNPGLFAGGVRADGESGFRVSPESPYFIIEGDEYDTAFFDKHAKFVHYRPRYLILTSLEYDHADIYPDYEHYELAFLRLLRLVPSEGLVVACYNDAGVRKVLRDHHYSPVKWYGGPDPSSDPDLLQTSTFRRHARRVEMAFPGVVEDFSLIGAHNTRNALGAALVAERLGLAAEDVRGALESFPGVLRRQQIRKRVEVVGGDSVVRDLVVIEDFAHHPTAVRETIAAVRETYPGHSIHVLFEPRSASSHRNVFASEYATAFAGADHVYITDVYQRDKVDESIRLDVRGLVDSINETHRSTGAGSEGYATFASDPAELLEKLRSDFQPSAHNEGDVILAMSNGAFGGIYPELDALAGSFSTSG